MDKNYEYSPDGVCTIKEEVLEEEDESHSQHKMCDASGISETPSKKQKLEPVPFTERNSTGDVRLRFDDGKELYVHPAFLSLASPVFNAMFDNDFREKKNGTVALRGKKYDAFLEFLLCLHPAHQRPVDRSNVFKIVALANEFQVPSIESKCKTTLEYCLGMSTKRGNESEERIEDLFNDLRWCLFILFQTSLLDYADLTAKAIAAVAGFGVVMYTNHSPDRVNITGFYSDGSKAQRQQCIEIFDKLSDSCKASVFFERLKRTDKNEMYW